MKTTSVYLLLGLSIFTLNAFSQETLQTVTSRGNTTSTGAIFDGNVGIGGTNQFNKLNLGGGLGDKLAVYNNETNTDFHGLGIAGYELYLKIPTSSHKYTFYQNNTDLMTILGNGNVGIGTDLPKDKLSVYGNIRATEIKVENQNWPDYVFKPGYKIPTLPELENFIKENNHLPEIPPAQDVHSEGVNLGDLSAKMLKKIEELTLLLIEKDKQISEQARQIEEIKKKIGL